MIGANAAALRRLTVALPIGRMVLLSRSRARKATMQLCCESLFVLNEGRFGAEYDRAGVAGVREAARWAGVRCWSR